MKKIKQFIDGLASDKKSHVVLGEVINLPIITTSMILGYFFLTPQFGVNIGILLCLLVHTSIEVWQKITSKGKMEFWDFVAGSYSAITLGVALNTLIFLK